MLLRRLAGQTAVYGLSSIVARLLNYLLTPYFTRFMTQSEYGVVTDFYALIPFVLIVLTMGMETGYFKFSGECNELVDKRKVFATTWGSVTWISLLFLAVIFVFRVPIAEIMGYADHVSYITVVAAIIALDAITAIPFARLREQNRALRYVVVRLFSVVINLLLCIFFYSILPRLAEGDAGLLSLIYYADYGAGYVFVANLVASLFTFVVLLSTCDGVFPKVDKALLKKILLYSLPLLISGIAGTANEFIDRQMIKYLMPENVAMEALGIYGAVVKIGVLMLMFTQMYRLAAEPFFLSGFDKDDFVKINAEAMKYFIIVSIFIYLVITLFSQEFALIIGRDFRVGMHILPTVLLANILSGMVLNLSFWYKKEGATRWAIVVTGAGLVFTILMNVVLVPRLGYWGAALARLCSETVMVAVSLYLNRKYCPTPYEWNRILLYVAVGVAVYFFAENFTNSSWWVRWVVSLALLSGYCSYVIRCEGINIKAMLKSIIKR
jgi:O-antigen/teichoic acid export membrane protein